MIFIKKKVYICDIKQTQKKHEKMEKKNNNVELAFNSIVKQTEKAICLNVMVSWNGNCRAKDIWFPKSVIAFTSFTDGKGCERTNAMVADWFIRKTEAANTFHGYAMHFETVFA